MNQKCAAFFEWIRGRKIAVIGIGVSNTPLIRLLAAKGARVTACDRKSLTELGDLVEELMSLGVTLKLGEHYLDELDAELLFRTPGMRPDIAPLCQARERGVTVTSEMEVFFALCPCKIIAVTGSDGKSTTTSLIAALLKAQGKHCHLGGNIGRPLLPDIEKIEQGDVAVLELSSFQLMTMRRSPDVAVITNVAPNHLDWHTSMEEYAGSKENIFLHQDENGLLVLNADNDYTRSYAARAKGRVLLFSRREKVDDGCYYADGWIRRVRNGADAPFLRRDELHLPGDHNVENFMAALCAVRGLVSDDTVRRVAADFAGLPHRLELVRELDGVRYYNDSIASSPTRTRACFASFKQKIIVILGGYDKKIAFDDFGADVVRNAKAVVLIGVTAPKIEQAIRSAAGYRTDTPILRQAASLEEAVREARALAAPGDVVVLSPACASFDMFRNFMERGDRFRELVSALN